MWRRCWTIDYIIYEVRISAKINGRNQGRRRQEGLIAKMLRNLPGLELEQLQVSGSTLVSPSATPPPPPPPPHRTHAHTCLTL